LFGNQIAISSNIAKQYNIRKGDTKKVKFSRTSPIIDVTVKYIFEESDFLLRGTINKYNTYDKGEIGSVVYSKDLPLYENNPLYLKFSTGSQSFNFAESVMLRKNSYQNEVSINVGIYLSLIILFVLLHYIKSSVLIYRPMKNSICALRNRQLLFEELKHGYGHYLILFTFMSFFLVDLVLPSLLIIFISLWFSIIIQKRIILWTKVSQ
jgi:hypothetical protein